MVITGNGELGFDSGEGAWEKIKIVYLFIFLVTIFTGFRVFLLIMIIREASLIIYLFI